MKDSRTITGDLMEKGYLYGVYSRHEQSGQRSDEKASVDEKQKSRIMVWNLKSKQ
ncbi:hypothetical protein NXH68_20680 [Phocaeicola vulgatus ATCC 8482]|uniref:hypothetical protein n=1 Tax=Phocaeicola vulgatus TaxID=821 RepID=UPI00234E6E65|nr:hypothetical protein [Phocaeicola vulgatus]MDC7311613.1 hypothetical protein [Phocaeicola vulgatus ATCC 8482]